MLKGKRGFYPTNKEGMYFRLFDNRKTNPRTCQIKAMYLSDRKELVIYSERDREFLVILTDKSMLGILGRVLVRGMTIDEIITTAISKKIIHPRISFSRISWEDIETYSNENRFYHYLRNC